MSVYSVFVFLARHESAGAAYRHLLLTRANLILTTTQRVARTLESFARCGACTFVQGFLFKKFTNLSRGADFPLIISDSNYLIE